MKKVIILAIAIVVSLHVTSKYSEADQTPLFTESDWTTIFMDEDGPTPGGGGQAFDAEFLTFKMEGNNLFVGLQTGFNLDTGTQIHSGKDYYAGDLALSFDGVTLGDASTYEYAVDYGFLTKDYNLNTVGGSTDDSNIYHPDDSGIYQIISWNEGIYFDASNPFAMDAGIKKGDLGVDVLDTGNDSFFRYVSFDITTIGLSITEGFTVDAHWTMSCGNDKINGSFDVASVPEPSTMLLFGTGLACLAGLCRRKVNHTTKS